MDINKRTSHLWHRYRDISFKFEIDIYQGKCAITSLPTILQQLSYLGFEGPILLNHPSETFCIFEDCDWGIKTPKRVFLGRWISAGSRDILSTYSLKKRKYISTTSMDSELALLTANLTHAGPGKLFYDPFVGTGSFPIACAHFGAVAMGSDIDGRSVRGKNGMDIVANFRQYGLLNRYLDGFLSDLTHHPFRAGRFLDGILCDPPYGVREGLKVLGSRREDGDGGGKEVVWLPNGEAAHLYVVKVHPSLSLNRLPPQTFTDIERPPPKTDKKHTSLPKSPTASTPCCTTSSTSPPAPSSTAAACRSGCPPPTTPPKASSPSRSIRA